jgi:2-polyprenyl-6-methoxyphenol hydroxylase-like FAD-dependent oxidoreductase/putative NADPH-quinone reductase
MPLAGNIMTKRDLTATDASSKSTIDVLIVGAGPTGLTLACDLARRGIHVRVIERFAVPSVASRGKGLQPRTLEVLDDLGVADTVLTRGTTRLPVRTITDDGTVIDRKPITVPVSDSTTTAYPETLWIGEFDIEGALRDRLALDGAQVEFGTTACGLEQHPDFVAVTVETPHGSETIRARWVVGADGGKSTVRHALGVGFDGFTMQDRWYLGDVRLEGLDHGRQYIFPTGSGMIGFTPLPTTDLWQWQSTTEAGDDAVQPSLELYQQMLDDHLGHDEVTLKEATWLSLYRANVRLAERYRVGRVLLAGDAAHAHSPAGGQAMNTGIQDSWNLGWKLAAVVAGADATLLDTYEDERRPIAASVLQMSTEKMHRFRAGATEGAEGVDRGLDGMGGDDTTGLSLRYPLTGSPSSARRTPLGSAAAVSPDRHSISFEALTGRCSCSPTMLRMRTHSTTRPRAFTFTASGPERSATPSVTPWRGIPLSQARSCSSARTATSPREGPCHRLLTSSRSCAASKGAVPRRSEPSPATLSPTGAYAATIRKCAGSTPRGRLAIERGQCGGGGVWAVPLSLLWGGWGVNTLIVTAHPDPDSLTHEIARQLAEAIRPSPVDVADLAAEGFDPRFTLADRHTYRVGGDFPADVVAEQRRLDAADHLVLVFPVYWWSMPALLKGWIDRVFVNGWAFDVDPEGGMRRNLRGLTTHLVPIAGDDVGVYERHGYAEALRTQIEHGIVDYCGSRRGATAFVHESERDDTTAREQSVRDAVTTIAAAVTA